MKPSAKKQPGDAANTTRIRSSTERKTQNITPRVSRLTAAAHKNKVCEANRVNQNVFIMFYVTHHTEDREIELTHNQLKNTDRQKMQAQNYKKQPHSGSKKHPTDTINDIPCGYTLPCAHDILRNLESCTTCLHLPGDLGEERSNFNDINRHRIDPNACKLAITVGINSRVKCK